VLVAHALATNRAWSLQAIDQYHAEGGTALYDALFGSLHMLRTIDGRRAIVVVTDGVDEGRTSKQPGSSHTLDDVLALAKQVDTSIFAVGLGHQVDRTGLEALTKVSGGRAYFPDDVSLLPEQYQRIVENLRRRYMISYTSTNSTRDGRWRSVEIRARLPHVQVTGRQGYYAPAR
jgi:Ca-activated chloride channel family protein